MNQVSEVVFLGVILDKYLSWKPHISHIARKMSKSIGVIFKSSYCLPKSSLRLLYYSLVYPYLQYCVTVWGSMYPANLIYERIILLQKRVVRCIKFGVRRKIFVNQAEKIASYVGFDTLIEEGYN
jgi:hypothetical protein